MDPEPTYTVFIRLPFPRNGFVDPPPIRWDTAKDEALWTILSGVSKNDIDWEELSERFQVTVDFLLQQAAYLTERHASQLRAQLRKATAAKGSAAPSPVPGSDSGTAAAEAMRRTGSGGGRAPSSLSVRKDSPLPRNDGSIPGTPGKSVFPRPLTSRHSSATTAVPTQKLAGGSSPRPDKPPVRPVSPRSQRSRLSSLPITTRVAPESGPQSPGPAESSSASSSSSSSSSSPVQSRIIRRPPRFQQHQDTGGSLADEEDEAEPAFLPRQPETIGGSSGHKDLGATLRGDPREFAAAAAAGKDRGVRQSQTSDSSASSAALVSRPPLSGGRGSGAGPRQGPLSPGRAAKLAGRGGAKARGYSREGSDGTPSMGSSFSDLDDASVTQSALEEALASKMNDGTIGSRMSTFSQAFKSRYMPKTNRP